MFAVRFIAAASLLAAIQIASAVEPSTLGTFQLSLAAPPRQPISLNLVSAEPYTKVNSGLATVPETNLLWQPQGPQLAGLAAAYSSTATTGGEVLGNLLMNQTSAFESSANATLPAARWQSLLPPKTSVRPAPLWLKPQSESVLFAKPTAYGYSPR